MGGHMGLLHNWGISTVLACLDLLRKASATMVLVTRSPTVCRWLGSLVSLGARSLVLSQWSSSVLSCGSKAARSATSAGPHRRTAAPPLIPERLSRSFRVP